MKKLKKIFTILSAEKRKYGFCVVLLRIPEYVLSALYFLFKLGNVNKAKHFHQAINPIHKFRYGYMERVNAEVLRKFSQRFLKGDRFIFKDIIFPKVKDSAMYHIYNDVFKVYVEYGDNYDNKLVDKLDKDLPEGVYCYTNKVKGVDITIHPGDVVIDAGAWAGDFSAYAAKKGAVVYAFEPAPSTVKLLKQTIEYNNLGDKIKIVESGLGDSNRIAYIKEEGVSGGNSISGDGSVPIKIIRLDDFVIQNKIEKIDFIKADIEGEERNMLAGACEVLKKFSPTLSICTYHLVDDPQVLEAIILDANPKYKVIQRKMKLFAYVEKS